MGRFFNKMVMTMRRIPSLPSKELEKMRRDYNKSLEITPEPSVPDTLKETRRANMAKAREARKRKKEEGNA